MVRGAGFVRVSEPTETVKTAVCTNLKKKERKKETAVVTLFSF